MERAKTRPRRRRGQYRSKGRLPKERVVFCVEGESEKVYIRALVEGRYGDAIVPVFWARKRESSLRNLIETARRRAKNEDIGRGVWILCDTDQNDVHRPMLEDWLEKGRGNCYAAVTDPCLEYWLLLHYVDSPHCGNVGAAQDELKKHLPHYVKGKTLPRALIHETDRAVRRERMRQTSADTSGIWPGHRCSQIPDLIAWLDELIERRCR